MRGEALSRTILPDIVVVCVFAALYFMNGHRNTQPNGIAASGTRAIAPDFSLPQLTGQKLDLSSSHGRVVLLDFWATWCEPCRGEIPHFVELQNKYRDQDQGLQVIGVSMDDSREPVRDFYQQFHMNYPVVMGDAHTGELYGGVLGLPVTWVLDREGRIYAKHIGATDVSVFEKEITFLLSQTGDPKTP